MKNDPLRDEAVYTLSQVAAAADVAVSLLKNWTDRGVFEADVQPAGRGTRAKFSFLSALHVALAARIVEMGVSPLNAAEIASLWTNVADAPGPDDSGRKRGGLYGSPFLTVFAFKTGHNATIRAIDPSSTRAAEAFLWLGTDDWKRVSMIVLDPIHERVSRVLGV